MMPVAGHITVTNAALRIVHEAEALQNHPGRTHIPSALNGARRNLAPGRDARVMAANMSPNSVTADVYLDYLGERHRERPADLRPSRVEGAFHYRVAGRAKHQPRASADGRHYHRATWR